MRYRTRSAVLPARNAAHRRHRIRPVLAAAFMQLAACSSAAPLALSTSTSAASSEVAPAGVRTAAPQPVTRIVERHTVDGVRRARIHHPSSAGPGARLIVVLHPAATSALDMETSFGWDTIADRDGLVVAYPDGVLDLFSNTWNGGRCCPPASQMGTDDIGFLNSLVDALDMNDAIGDTVYAVGFSNGAILAYAWACSSPPHLMGIGIVAGALMADCPSPAPVDVVAMHGTADTSIPIEGSPAPDNEHFPALDDSLAPFRTADGCPAEPDPSSSDSAISEWTCIGHRVTRVVVPGQGHVWPGAGPTAGTGVLPSDATGFLWAQLSR